MHIPSVPLMDVFLSFQHIPYSGTLKGPFAVINVHQGSRAARWQGSSNIRITETEGLKASPGLCQLISGVHESPFTIFN